MSPTPFDIERIIMITTVTLNASIDKAYVLDGILNPGIVMRVKEVRNTAGGKGLNVTKLVNLCGQPVLATGFLGGFNGKYLEFLLEQDQIASQFTWVQGETRSCINILEDKFSSTEFLEPGFTVSAEEELAFLDNFRQLLDQTSIVTISGSLPKGVSPSIYGTLIAETKAAGKRVILDSSGASFKEGLLAKPTMVKPNQEELEALFDVTISSTENVITYGQKLVDQGIEYVLISLGGEGAVLLHAGKVYQGRPPKIDPVNTVGCGDSMVGAFAVALERNYSPVDCLKFAIAVGTANALSPFTGNFDPEILDNIHAQVTVEEVK